MLINLCLLALQNTMEVSRGAVSMIFYSRCTQDERNELTNFFGHLHNAPIKQDDAVIGYTYRIGDFNCFLASLCGPKDVRTTATQTDNVINPERPISPSIFTDFESTNQLYSIEG